MGVVGTGNDWGLSREDISGIRSGAGYWRSREVKNKELLALGVEYVSLGELYAQ